MIDFRAVLKDPKRFGAAITYGKNNVTVSDEKVAREQEYQQLTVRFPKDSFNPSNDPVGGFGLRIEPRAVFPAQEAFLEYEMLVPETFNWVKGGKLPGLYWGQYGASGGKHSDDGGSVRLMWRAGGGSEAYVYFPSDVVWDTKIAEAAAPYIRNKKHGDSLWRGTLKFKKNEWNKIRLYLRLNTVGKDDGVLKLRINGVELSHDRFIFRTKPDMNISGLMFSCFFGGSTKEWAAQKDEQLAFRNISFRR
jgi:hypothetical protein